MKLLMPFVISMLLSVPVLAETETPVDTPVTTTEQSVVSTPTKPSTTPSKPKKHKKYNGRKVPVPASKS